MVERIIKFWDNEKYDYPLIAVNENDITKFKKLLKEYQKDDTYNFDDFIALVKDNNIECRLISVDEEMFF